MTRRWPNRAVVAVDEARTTLRWLGCYDWGVMQPRAVVPFVVLALGCNSGSGSPVAPLPGSGVDGTSGYPEGPYGPGVGQIIEPYVLPGYPRPQEASDEGARIELSLAEFYNPTGDATYAAGSPFEEGAPKPLALIINVSAVWCAPCKLEAEQLLPEEYARIKPLGGELMLVLADSGTPGEPASFEDLENWVNAFPVTYPATIDPSYQLGALFDTSSYPANFLVDTRTMTIVEVVKGIPGDSFWAEVDALIAP
jgi:hypothetical protein